MLLVMMVVTVCKRNLMIEKNPDYRKCGGGDVNQPEREIAKGKGR